MVLAILSPAGLSAVSAGDTISVWQPWEAVLTASAVGAPASDAVLSVTFHGPDGRTLAGRGFWDGGGTFRIRCTFPVPGAWSWQTEFSGPADSGLGGRSGAVEVKPASGDNPLHRHGPLRVSDDRRYLTHADGTPFLWIADTAWLAYIRATQAEWERWVLDRRSRGFTVLLTSCSVTGGRTDQTDAEGNAPFVGPGQSEPNPVFWRNFERKIRFANEQGLVVCITGTIKGRWVRRPVPEVISFNEYLAARLAGSAVVLSPEQDWGDSPPVAVALQAAEAIHRAAPGLLVTQHPMRRPMPALVLENFHRPAAIDFVGVQTGIGAAPDGTPVDLADATRATVEWIDALCRAEPRKPVVNLEGVYDEAFDWDQPGLATEMVRRGAYYTFLGGGCGFTTSTFGLWSWGRPVQFGQWGEPVRVETALNRPYATTLFHFATLLRQLDWWNLEPRPEAIVNQSEDWARRLAFARTPDGKLGLAYLPDNDAVVLQWEGAERELESQWFNPRTGELGRIDRIGRTQMPLKFSRPGPGDWLLILRAPGHSPER